VRVFISYRRAGSEHLAGRLRDSLAREFGEEKVFLDVYSIGFGEDFRDTIRNSMTQVDALIVLISPDFDTARLHDEADTVRTEIREAFQQHKFVVPVLQKDSKMPLASELPVDIRDLAFRNAAPLRPDPDFPRDAAALITTLRTMDQAAALRLASLHTPLPPLPPVPPVLPPPNESGPEVTRQVVLAPTEQMPKQRTPAPASNLVSTTAKQVAVSRRWRIAWRTPKVIAVVAAAAAIVLVVAVVALVSSGDSKPKVEGSATSAAPGETPSTTIGDGATTAKGATTTITTTSITTATTAAPTTVPKPVEVPNFIGLRLAVARDKAGTNFPIVVNEVRVEFNSADDQKVRDQSQNPGDLLPVGTAIQLDVNTADTQSGPLDSLKACQSAVPGSKFAVPIEAGARNLNCYDQINETIDLVDACRKTYRNKETAALAMSVVTVPNQSGGAQCRLVTKTPPTTAGSPLGGLSLTEYCQSVRQPLRTEKGPFFDTKAAATGNTASTWVCRFQPKLGQTDFTTYCLKQYGSGVGAVANASKPSEWVCKRI
jgi:hypothetical protein